MRRKIGTCLIVLGALLALGALALTGYNFWDDQRADAFMQTTLSRVRASIRPENPAPTENLPADADDLDPERDMPTVEIDGYRYIGTLTIPILGLELPVMETWDYTRLRYAPCRYLGSVYQNNLIIAAHNYTSHFGLLKNLQPGDEIYFTDAEGNVFGYAVLGIETLAGSAVEEMESGEWDMTLFTCTYGGRTRVTVRCGRLTDEPA